MIPKIIQSWKKSEPNEARFRIHEIESRYNGTNYKNN